MKTMLRQLKCGNCGSTTVNLFMSEEKRETVIAECINCESTTEITASHPELEFNFGPRSEGILCIY